MPALPEATGHALWNKHYSGASGVFSFVMHHEDIDRHRARFASLDLIRIGASWGGTHSLIAPSPVNDGRCRGIYDGKQVVRLSTGLEDVAAIYDDLDRFLDR